MIWIVAMIVFWAAAWSTNVWLANSAYAEKMAVRISVPVLFGITILVLWECLVRGFGVSQVILPPPSQVMAVFAQSTDLLWVDFVQTVVKGALRGFLMGGGGGLCRGAVD